jgi:uncharacterized protein (DUF885 family)
VRLGNGRQDKSPCGNSNPSLILDFGNSFPHPVCVESLLVKRIASVILIVLTGCQFGKSGHPYPSASSNPHLDALVGTYLDHRSVSSPGEAASLGYHVFDGKFVVPTVDWVAAERTFTRRQISRLDRIQPANLSPEDRVEFEILSAALTLDQWNLETLQSYSRNPMTYANALDVSLYLKRDWKPLAERFRDINRILLQAPALFLGARQLDSTLARPLVETAIEVSEATGKFIGEDIAREADKLTDPSIKSEFDRASRTAISSLKAYAEWLRTDRLPKATAPFALVREGFAARLKAERIDLAPEKVLELGMAELRREQERFAAAARIIDPTRPAIEVFKAIQKDHPTAENLISDTRRNLESIRQFVVDRDLITIPSEVRAIVTETLPPFRATSFASMDTPGPFETNATQAYYYVTPTEPGWTDAQKDEWLTAFNYYTTDVVSIHEAYPGHYVQFLALNASTASRLSRTYNSYAFVEGWAHYTEQMLIEEGFAGPQKASVPPSHEDILRAAKYRLAQSDEALLRLCRLCVAVQMHCNGMTVDQGTRFFVENSYYEEKPARSEATRGTFDPGYCFYTLGKLQILKLRSDWQAQEGPKFTLRRFHDELLRHGAPPIRLLREIMLRDPGQWSQIL